MADRSAGEPPDGLTLEGPITAAEAPALKQRLVDHLAAGAPCQIRAHAVDQLDGAGAQLLYAFVREAERLGNPARWVSASRELGDAARLLGMVGCLGLTEEALAWRP